MALGVTEEHGQLADSVCAWAERHSPPGVTRAVADRKQDGAAHYRDALRPALAEQGLLGLHVPESDGGQGFGLPELTVAVEELGRALVPGVFVPTALASAVLVAAGSTSKFLPMLANGEGNGAVALAAHFTAAAGDGADLIINGHANIVLGAVGADVIILPVRSGQGSVWVVVPAASLEISPVDSLDLTRQLGRVTATDVVVPLERQLSGLTSAMVANVAAVVLGAEAIGMAGWAVHTAAEYAKIRHQFGRPIGQFQAVKHRCARMLVAAEQATAAVWDAARAVDENDAASEFAAAVAAMLAADAAVYCTHECIQVLGGIGYTWEHDAHLYYRRAMTLRALLSRVDSAGQNGADGTWQERVARLALAGGRRVIRLELPGGGDDELRARIRAEIAEITRLPAADRNAALGAGGWVMPHMPKPWGRGAGALEQLIIDEELRSAGVHVPGLAIGAWVVPALIQYGTPA